MIKVWEGYKCTKLHVLPTKRKTKPLLKDSIHVHVQYIVWDIVGTNADNSMNLHCVLIKILCTCVRGPKLNIVRNKNVRMRERERERKGEGGRKHKIYMVCVQCVGLSSMVFMLYTVHNKLPQQVNMYMHMYCTCPCTCMSWPIPQSMQRDYCRAWWAHMTLGQITQTQRKCPPFSSHWSAFTLHALLN